MEITENVLDYNPFSKENRHRHFFQEAKLNVNEGSQKRKQWGYQLYNEIFELALSRFEWTGLPENMPKYYLEKKLLLNGHGLIYQTETDGLFVGVGTMSRGRNHYEEATHYQVVSPMGEQNKEYELGVNGVLVRNDSNALPDVDLILTYVETLMEIRTTQLVNLNTMRTPFMLKGDEKTKSSIIEQYNQVRFGAPYIIVDPELSERHGESLDVLATNTPYYLDQLQNFFNDIHNELLTFLGVNNNPSQDKKERLLVDEVNVNNTEINASLETRLQERKRAAEKANELFGTNITVEVSETYTDQLEKTMMSVGQFSNTAAEYRRQELGDKE